MARVDREHLHDMWELMPTEVQEALKKAIEIVTAKTKHEKSSIIRRCPRCGARNTTDCRGVEGIADSTIGLCITCGYLWCLECDVHLIASIVCGHWKICAGCGERKDELGYCGKVPWECRHIKLWLEKNNPIA
ncbi:MAG: hypothetical protein C0392_08875 [Syntrophus sp. (in: bacteria)]|nr:hypothetical protein [Syntrophus sp. (in: bacteria)]